MHLNSINAANLKTSLKFCVILPWALLGRLRDRDVWIITERQDQARDNGYVFFKYVREKYPKQKIVYIIEKSGRTDQSYSSTVGRIITIIALPRSILVRMWEDVNPAIAR